MPTDPAAIPTLGPCERPSPLPFNVNTGDAIGNFTPDRARIRFSVEEDGLTEPSPLRFEKAGPRQKIFFDPARLRAAIVTCGGLCPGLNAVIRSAYRQFCSYGVPAVFGIRYGYQGMSEDFGLEPVHFDDEMVEDIHRDGGTVLGSSRGTPPVPHIVRFLRRRDIRVLLTIGGDGTQRGAREISEEAMKQNYPLAVVGIPKTIDNDVQFVKQTFGFASAVDQARQVLSCAHAEARAYYNGVSIVRLMGRDSGFIAACSTLASQEVNFTLVPEVPFLLEGERGLFAALERRLQRKRHALIVVAEGAGQHLLAGEPERRDASGNRLHADIGQFLRGRIAEHFQRRGLEINLKYIDPSYIIRSVPANSEDAVLCDHFGRNAVHAAMAGKTDLLVGYWNDFIHVPLAMVTSGRRKISPDGLIWSSVLSATGQPVLHEGEGA